MDLVSMLILNEGMRLKPYKDSVGKLTIGVGRNLDDVGISKDEALEMLKHDIISVEEQLKRNLPWYLELDEPRRNVLIDMCFNMGIGGLLAWGPTLTLISQKNFKQAALHMLKSPWAAQVGNRAQRNAYIMESGQWPK